MLVHLAYAVVEGDTSLIGRATDAQRTASKDLADILSDLKIQRREEAFQTVAKGTSDLLSLRARSEAGAAFVPLLLAARDKSLGEVSEILRYLAAGIADTARDLPPLPALDVRRLTFRRVVTVIQSLLAASSGGAYEQFVLAALLHALAEEHGNRKVVTKTLSASDRSASSAADIQILDGGIVIDAYEVTANEWPSKIRQAALVLIEHDLKRVHIVAPDADPSPDWLQDEIDAARLPEGLDPEDFDLSVLDLQTECRSLVHRLTRPGRREAIVKLREHLVERQPEARLVRELVEALEAAGVVDDS